MTKMIHNYTAANTIDASADLLLIDPASSGIYKSINRNTFLSLASAPLGTTDSQSPQNKTFDNTNSLTVKDGSLTIQNSAGITKQAVFSAASITAGQTRTFTFPDASGTLATIAGTQTFTNKTLTSPSITGGTIDNATITVDSIAGHTLATTVTVGNLQIANGVLNTANSVTATAISAGAVQPQALVTGTGAGWSWTSFTPSWSFLTVGNGTSTAAYLQTGKWVSIRLFFQMGSTSAMSSSPSFVPPVPAKSAYAAMGNYVCGYGNVNTSSGQQIAMPFFAASVGNITIGYNTSAGTGGLAGITSTVPGTWTTSNYFTCFIEYEAA